MELPSPAAPRSHQPFEFPEQVGTAHGMLGFFKKEIEGIAIMDEPAPVTGQDGQVRLMGLAAPFFVDKLVGERGVPQRVQPVPAAFDTDAALIGIVHP